MAVVDANAPRNAPAFEVHGFLPRGGMPPADLVARDELPEIPGAREQWGRDLLHCPCCHGWEVRDLVLEDVEHVGE